MKHWKQSVALFLTGVLVMTSLFTWNSPIRVHAEEAVIKSSAKGFEYRLKTYESGYTEYICTSDTTQIYDNYKDAIKGIAEISRKIMEERKAETYVIKIPVEIKANQKVDDIENGANPFDDAVQKETYKETGNPDEGQGLAQFLYARGNLLNDDLDLIKYDNSTKSYKGVFYYHTLHYSVSYERYSKTITKLKEVLNSLNLDGKSDYEKCKAIREWIGKNVKYDDEYFKNPGSCPRKNAHDMTGAVLDGYTVCDGFANLFHYMASEAGLLTLFEEGPTKVSGIQHAWNLVRINGTFYYIDCTSVSLDKNGEAYDEFLLGQDTMFNLRVTPKNDTIESTYSNISKDDWSKEHSKCNGNHDLNMDAPARAGARCGIKGYVAYKCKNCNYDYREWIPALEHIWDNGTVTQKQDCTHPEITTYKCTRKDVWGTNGTCDGTKEVQTKPSLGGHKWQSGEITKSPTCTTAGEQQYTCTVCHQTKIEPVKATGHDWEIKITKEATCTSNGTYRRTCKTCGYFENHSITATGHKPEIRNKKEATCSTTGYTGDTYCSVCNKKLSSGKTIAKTSHTWIKQDNIPATCEKGELEVEKCSVCGETKETEISDPLGHDYGEWVVIKKPTCTKYGLNKRYCKRCNDFEVDTPEPTGHQHTKIIDQKPATCEEKGYTGDVYCEDCRIIIQDGKEIAATGHDWDDGKITKEPTQTSTGIKTYTCKTCKKTKEEIIPMLKGHHWDQGTITKQPTCTEQGEKTYKCTDEDCDETYTESIPATGHKNTKVINQKNATCESDGSRTYTCDTCKETKTEFIKATGHSYGAWITTQEATVFSPEQQKRTCSKCNKEETRINGSKLKPTIRTNAASLKLKKKQSTSKFTVTGLAKGDYIRSWTSSNKKLITITGNKTGTCKIKVANKTGKAKITITLASGLKKTITVTVQKKAVTPTAIKNVPKSITLNKKQTYQLKPTIEPITYIGKAKYRSSNKKIVKVSSTGKITAVKPGKAKITISASKKKSVCTVTVKK